MEKLLRNIFAILSSGGERPAAPQADLGLYGRWLNPLGMWDWWEFGGRFNGVITGERRPASDQQFISSGESTDRAIIGNLVSALGGTPASAEAEIEHNVELVEALRTGLARDEGVRRPLAILLPPDAGPDAGRWLNNREWHTISAESRALLGASADAGFRDLVRLAYDHYRDRAAAGIVYHL